METKFDAIVIGSGFGGGTVALRLAQAGKHVCVLERGRRWKGSNMEELPTDKPSTPFPEPGDSHFVWGRRFWHPMRQRLGLVDVKMMPNLNAMVSSGVGGGSLLWSNVVIEAPERIFAQGWPAGINREVLEPYYKKAVPYLRPNHVPGAPGIPCQGFEPIVRAQTVKAAAEATSAHWKAVKVAVNFNGSLHVSQPNGHGAARQLACSYCGGCNFGCPQNAKNTVDVTYIAAAEALGVEVRPLHFVTAIEPVANGNYRVHYRRFNLEGRLTEKGFLQAPLVVLSAGTFGTTKLLLKSKTCGYLPNLSPALGNRFSANGSITGGILLPQKAGKGLRLNHGPVIAGIVDYGHYVIEDLTMPGWIEEYMRSSSLGRIKFLLKVFAGIKPKANANKFKEQLLVLGGISDDGAKGCLGLNSLGTLSLRWPGGIYSEPVIAELHKAMNDLASALGGKYIPNVLSVFNVPVTVHPLGGCPMADQPTNGVVDAFGCVHGYPGLYIADGSILPTATGRNPAFTIAALSERVAENITLQTSH